MHTIDVVAPVKADPKEARQARWVVLVAPFDRRVPNKVGGYDDTVILFTADHGDYGAQFRSFYKGLPYEGSTHVPFVVRDPRSPNHGRTEGAHVSNMDLFASSLAWAGASAPAICDSRDFTSLLQGNRSDWDNVACWSTRNQAMLVRNGLKVMREARKDGSVYEAYDLQADPLEACNIADAPAEADRVDSLRQELDAWCAVQGKEIL